MKKLKNKSWSLLISGFIFSMIFIVFFISKTKSHRFFVEIPLKTFTEKKTYYFEAEIENQKIPLLLDTGLQFPLILQTKTLEKLKNKKQKGFSESFDVKGKAFNEMYYQIDQMRIEKLYFEKINVRECPEENLITWGYVSEGEDTPFKEIPPYIKEKIDKKVGYFGMEAIRAHDCWLMDFPNAKLYYIAQFANTLKKLQKPLSSFTEADLLLTDHSILYVNVQTDFGKKVFMIDTGAEVTVMQCPSKEVLEHQVFISKTFSIGGFDFGNQEIYFYNISKKFQCDGVIGIDFLKDKALLLDFKNNRILITH